ncbi:nuclear transport factor 2 family protein [Spartinivicinus ruber]|uniref:nuclear transport factor 2 family protein n=1 Tax=Spartinivicinus ruber TaxID=2683272 RepID=UPI0013D23A09|nr:nuclear transport factor 2 family protein [Spartinivicinus ruber]
MTPEEIVIIFWQTMNANNFYKASEWLAEDFECYWPQSSELIVGRDNFAKINTHYPVNGEWKFHINNILGKDNQVVTEVEVSDNEVSATVITFHKVEKGVISRQKEYWPDSFETPLWRRQWVVVV